MKILSSIFTIIAALLLPLGAGLWLSLKKKGYFKPVILGALTFFVFQFVTRIPLLQYILPRMSWFIVMNMAFPFLSALFLGVTAALFEEGGRYLVMSLFMKNRQRTMDGIAFGIGHGGIEAILLAGVNVLILMLMRDNSVSAGMMFAGGVERISAMICHIAWSVMVLKSVRDRQIVWLLAAFGLHALLDTAAVLAVAAGFTMFTIEVAVGIFALLMLGYIIYEYTKTKEKTA